MQVESLIESNMLILVKLKWSKLVKAVQSHIASLNFSYQVELRDKKVNYVNSYGKFENEHTIKV